MSNFEIQKAFCESCRKEFEAVIAENTPVSEAVERMKQEHTKVSPSCKFSHNTVRVKAENTTDQQWSAYVERSRAA
jgi:predicted GNAT family acetyltransferase